MSLDAITLRGILTELNQQLENAIVNKVLMPEKDEIHLIVRQRDRNMRLVLSCGGNPRIHLTKKTKENPATPPMFCMLLRKHLGSARIREIRQFEMDRVVEIIFETRDELGILRTEKLVLELFGGASNLLFLNEEGRILDCIRKTDLENTKARKIIPGFFYEYPPRQNKRLYLELEEVSELYQPQNLEQNASQVLLNALSGLSPLCCRELVYRSCGETDKRLRDIPEEELQKQLEYLKDIVWNNRYLPVLMMQNSEPKDFSFWIPQQYEGIYQTVKMDSFSQLLDYFYDEKERILRKKQHSSELVKSVQALLQRNRRKTEIQKQELVEAQDREAVRRNADLIMANLYQIKRGDRELKCVNYYDPEQKEITIKLDPRLSPQENASKAYKLYAKRKNAEKILLEQIKKGESDTEYLESVLEELERAETVADLEEIREELVNVGFLKTKSGKKKTSKSQAQKPLHFKSTQGVDFWAGKNNRQNDFLTLKFANKRDLWLHTQKIHGCHVIVDTTAGDPDNQTILEAATVAATYSKAALGYNVPVDYCPVKQVKKPNGAKPGMVIYENYKTLYVTPDPKLCEKLLQS